MHEQDGLFVFLTFSACLGFIFYEFFRIANRNTKTNVADIACISKFATMPFFMLLWGWPGMFASVLLAGVILALPQIFPDLKISREPRYPNTGTSQTADAGPRKNTGVGPHSIP